MICSTTESIHARMFILCCLLNCWIVAFAPDQHAALCSIDKEASHP